MKYPYLSTNIAGKEMNRDNFHPGLFYLLSKIIFHYVLKE